jgi:innexin
MLGIPLLSTYIQRIVKQQCVADSVDWLNYFCSARLLAFFALAISAKQYFGSPIQCWTPNEFKGSWERYAEDYCFVAHSYYVPLDEEVPRSVADRHDQISYYRSVPSTATMHTTFHAILPSSFSSWVPVALAVQALLFWLPSWLWNISHKQTAINPRAVLNEASKSRALFGNEREKEIQGMAAFVSDTVHFRNQSSSKSTEKEVPIFQLAVFSEERPRHPSGMNATLIYLVIKLLYLLNCCAQLIVLNRFLGGQYHIWAWEVGRVSSRILMEGTFCRVC